MIAQVINKSHAFRVAEFFLSKLLRIQNELQEFIGEIQLGLLCFILCLLSSGKLVLVRISQNYIARRQVYLKAGLELRGGMH